MGIGYRIEAEFENGNGGVVGKIGYYILMSVLLVIFLPISLIAMPFIKLSERRAAKRAQDSGGYDNLRIQ